MATYQKIISISGKISGSKNLDIKVIGQDLDTMEITEDDYDNYIQRPILHKSTQNFTLKEKNKMKYFQINNKNVIIVWL